MERITDICTQVENDLALFVGGELEAPTQAALERHLESCAACTVKARAARAGHAALRRGLTAAAGGAGDAARVASATLDLWPAIRARLEREGRFARPTPAEGAAARAPFASRPVAPRSSARVHARYAAAAALLVAALGWWTFGRESAPIAPRVPIVEATPVNGVRSPALPVIQPTDALARGLQRVPLGAPALRDRAGEVDVEAELRSPIFNDPRELEISPTGERAVLRPR